MEASLRPGDIVRYKIFPHEELHLDGMVGLVLTKPQVAKDHYGELVTVDVMWPEERKPSGNNITWEYIDEIERIGEAI